MNTPHLNQAPPGSLGIPYASEEPHGDGTWSIVCPVCTERLTLMERKDFESFTHSEYAEHYEQAIIDELEETKWWETYDNIVKMVWHMTEYSSAEDIAYAIEKPWKFTETYLEALREAAREVAPV